MHAKLPKDTRTEFGDFDSPIVYKVLSTCYRRAITAAPKRRILVVCSSATRVSWQAACFWLHAHPLGVLVRKQM